MVVIRMVDGRIDESKSVLEKYSISVEIVF
jgi:hypothetical protein